MAVATNAGGKTHKELLQFFQRRFTVAKMEHYVRARESFLVECFNCALLKFAPKRLFFSSSYKARIWAAVLHWNENIQNQLKAIYQMKPSLSSRQNKTRKRPKKKKVKERHTFAWVDLVFAKFLEFASVRSTEKKEKREKRRREKDAEARLVRLRACGAAAPAQATATASRAAFWQGWP